MLGATLLALRILRRGEKTSVQQGLIPGMEADTHAQASAGSLR